MQTSSPFRLGFDGGGTKTRAVVIDALDSQARVLGAGESGASNPYAVGMKTALDNLERAAALALAEAKLPRQAIAGWGLGLGGVCSRAEGAKVEAALRERVGDGARIVAVEDVVAAWLGAFGGEMSADCNAKGGLKAPPRAVCIAGTGANCWGQNARGEVAQADGAGPLLGDRGSGYWIGEQAVRHAARVLDGVVETDEFGAAVTKFLGARDLKTLIRVVYAPNFERSQLAGLVPTVLQYAQNHAPNAAACAILENAGRELALTSLAVLRRLSNHEEIGGDVALIGGVLAHAQPVKLAFTQTLQRRAPRTHLVEARFEPAVGAALLC